MPYRLDRRRFLRTSAVLAAGTALSARSWAAVAGANSDVRIAIVGLNGRGRGHVRAFGGLPGVRIAALCDVDTAVLERAAQAVRTNGGAVDALVDVREVLARSDIDAISIATPNHLHALLAIWAIQAGKDVYLEKPVSHNVWEGRQIIAAAAQHGRIVQAGMQCRSSTGLAEAVAWVRSGQLGRVTAVRGLCYKRRDSIGRTSGPQPVPDTVAYDLWLGPAARRAPRRARFHYDWHWFWDYGNGDLGNQGVHQVDIARWFLGEEALAPHVLSVGGRFGYADDGETANTQVIVHEYPTAPLIFEVRGLPAGPDPRPDGAEAANAAGGARPPAPMDTFRGASIGVVVHCEGGTVVVPSYTEAQAYDREDREIRRWSGATDHFANFIDAVRSRRAADLHAPVLAGHLSSALCHTANISHRLGRGRTADAVRAEIRGHGAMEEAFGRMAEHLGRHGIRLDRPEITLGQPLTLDVARERFTGSRAAAANALLTREYRAPFVVPPLAS